MHLCNVSAPNKGRIVFARRGVGIGNEACQRGSRKNQTRNAIGVVERAIQRNAGTLRQSGKGKAIKAKGIGNGFPMDS